MQFPFWKDFCHSFEFPEEMLNSEGKTFLVGLKQSYDWEHSLCQKKKRGKKEKKKCVKKITKYVRLDTSLDLSLNG